VGTARAVAGSVVDQHMSRPVAVVAPGTPLDAIRERMWFMSCLVVTGREGEPLGVISRSDFLRAARLRATLAGSPRLLIVPRVMVADRMTRRLISVGRRASVAQAAARMVAARVHRVVVLDGRFVAGVLSATDVMRELVARHVESPIRDCMTAQVETVEFDTPIGAALDRMLELGVRGLVVTDNEHPVGVFTQHEALESIDLDASVPVEEAMSEAMVCLPSRTPLCVAAAEGLASRARRVLAVDGRRLRGIVTGMDAARVAAGGL
jgi:CBS domain-containing protein